MTEGKDLLQQYTADIISGEAQKKLKKMPKNHGWAKVGSRLPVHRPKDSGQPTSKSGFPKGKVGTGGSWTPD